MATRKITEETLVEVINTSTGSVGYTPEMSRVPRKWERQDVSKKVKLGELRDVISTSGGWVLFEEGILLIKDGDIRAELGLPELTEYNLDGKQIKELLLNGSIEKLAEVLEYAGVDMKDSIVAKAIDLEIADLNKINLIEEECHAKVLDSIRAKKEESEEKKEKPATRGRKKATEK